MEIEITQLQPGPLRVSEALNRNQISAFPDATPHRIKNAWSLGAIIDGRGNVWLDVEKLSEVIDVPFMADFNRFHPRKCDSFSHGGCWYLRGAQVAEMIHSIAAHYERTLQGDRPYEKSSLEIYRLIRNCPVAKERQRACLEGYAGVRRDLREKRIEQIDLDHDEVTGEPLSRDDCEFCYVRAPYFYEELAHEVFNGLIVNPETYQMIRKAHPGNERDLFNLFNTEDHKTGWLVSWFQDYGKNLKSFRSTLKSLK